MFAGVGLLDRTYFCMILVLVGKEGRVVCDCCTADSSSSGARE